MFRNGNPSNLRGSLLEGNKDHLLNQERSDLAKTYFMSRPSISASVIHKNERRRKTAHYRTYQDVQNEFVESRREQTRLQEELLRKENGLRHTQIRSMHEIGKMNGAEELRVDE